MTKVESCALALADSPALTIGSMHGALRLLE